jgi:hypothetical protein
MGSGGRRGPKAVAVGRTGNRGRQGRPADVGQAGGAAGGRTRVEAKGKVAAAQRASSTASFQIFCESLMTQWAHGGKTSAQDNRYVRQLELVCSSVNRQTYVTVYSSVSNSFIGFGTEEDI